MNYIQGNLVAKEVKIGIVAGRFNELITTNFLSCGHAALLRPDVKD